jgi:hypothetical protein
MGRFWSVQNQYALDWMKLYNSTLFSLPQGEHFLTAGNAGRVFFEGELSIDFSL